MAGWKKFSDIPKVGKTYELDFEHKMLHLDNPTTHVILAVRMKGAGNTAASWGNRIPAVYSDKNTPKYLVGFNSLLILGFPNLRVYLFKGFQLVQFTVH